ncbi:MAG TPA: hypothetical protein VJV74_01820, partial [Terriglobia bacterium]|nr:hypothetical protein [Terriglobia bacterium]
ELAQTALKHERLLPKLQARLNTGISRLLHSSLDHPEIWTRVWSDGGLHIVGDANIGEIRFEKNGAGGPDEEGEEEGEEGGQDRLIAIQRLWWRAPHPPEAPGAPAVPGDPLPATEYRASLNPPAVKDAPPLP